MTGNLITSVPTGFPLRLYWRLETGGSGTKVGVSKSRLGLFPRQVSPLAGSWVITVAHGVSCQMRVLVHWALGPTRSCAHGWVDGGSWMRSTCWEMLESEGQRSGTRAPHAYRTDSNKIPCSTAHVSTPGGQCFVPTITPCSSGVKRYLCISRARGNIRTLTPGTLPGPVLYPDVLC